MEQHALSTGVNKDSLTTYDEDGFLISSEEAPQTSNRIDSQVTEVDDESDTEVELSTDDAEKELLTSEGTTPVVTLPPNQTSSATSPPPDETANQDTSTPVVDIGSLTEARQSPSLSDEGLSSPELVTEGDLTSSVSSISLSEGIEEEDSWADDEDTSDSSLELSRCSKSGEQDEAVDHEQESAEEPKDDSDLDESPPSGVLEHALEHYVATHGTPKGDELEDILQDLWLEEQDMYFWEYEALFIIKLAAFRFKRYFIGAREVYQVDPFMDYD